MCKSKPYGGDVVKASLNRATEYMLVDPKPGDLTMGRLKRG